MHIDNETFIAFPVGRVHVRDRQVNATLCNIMQHCIFGIFFFTFIFVDLFIRQNGAFLCREDRFEIFDP